MVRSGVVTAVQTTFLSVLILGIIWLIANERQAATLGPVLSAVSALFVMASTVGRVVQEVTHPPLPVAAVKAIGPKGVLTQTQARAKLDVMKKALREKTGK